MTEDKQASNQNEEVILHYECRRCGMDWYDEDMACCPACASEDFTLQEVIV